MNTDENAGSLQDIIGAATDEAARRGQVREASLAPFLTWRARGDALVCVAVRFSTNDKGPNFLASPAILIPASGRPQALAEVQVGINKAMSDIISDEDAGRVILLRYQDDKPTRSGRDMRVFSRVDVDAALLESIISRMPHDEKVKSSLRRGFEKMKREAVQSAPSAAPIEETTDDLPF